MYFTEGWYHRVRNDSQVDVAYLDGVVPRLGVLVQVVDEPLRAAQHARGRLGALDGAHHVRRARVDRRLQTDIVKPTSS